MNKSIVPETDTEYADGDFESASARMAQARQRVMADPKAQQAAVRLGEQIRDRVEAKRATLAVIRKALELTQEQLAETLGLSQAQISKIERSPNLHLSTLVRFIAATGGQVRIVAKYGETEVDLAITDVATQGPLVDA